MSLVLAPLGLKVLSKKESKVPQKQHQTMPSSTQSLLLALDSIGFSEQLDKSNHLSLRSRWARASVRLALERRRRLLKVKRRKLLVSSRRPVRALDRHVGALRRLVPSGGESSVGLRGLFREAADYIACLKVQVQGMQMALKMLSGE